MDPSEGKDYGSLYGPFSALISSGTLPPQGSNHATKLTRGSLNILMKQSTPCVRICIGRKVI